MNSIANRAAAANDGLDAFLESNLGRDLLRFLSLIHKMCIRDR